MTSTFSSTALAWLLTYAIHSTVLFSLAWLLVRARRWSPGASELLWKTAMVGAIITASTQQWLDVRPAGTIMLQREAVGGRREAATATQPSVIGEPESRQASSKPALADPNSVSQFPHSASRLSPPPSRFP